MELTIGAFGTTGVVAATGGLTAGVGAGAIEAAATGAGRAGGTGFGVGSAAGSGRTAVSAAAATAARRAGISEGGRSAGGVGTARGIIEPVKMPARGAVGARTFGGSGSGGSCSPFGRGPARKIVCGGRPQTAGRRTKGSVASIWGLSDSLAMPLPRPAARFINANISSGCAPIWPVSWRVRP